MPSGFGTLHPQEWKEYLVSVFLLSSPAGRKVQTGGKLEILSSATSLPEPAISPAKLTRAPHCRSLRRAPESTSHMAQDCSCSAEAPLH